MRRADRRRHREVRAGLTKADLRDQTKLVARRWRSLQKYFDEFAPELSDAVFEDEPDTEHGGFKIVCPREGRRRAQDDRRSTSSW